MTMFYAQPAKQKSINRLLENFPITAESEFINYLNRYNGIFIDGDDYIDIGYTKVNNGFISFQALFGLDSENKNFNIEVVNKELRHEIHSIENPLIIGDDPGGNFYVAEGNSWKIFYWDRIYLHNETGSDHPDIIGQDQEGNYYVISNSFGEFFEILNAFFMKMDSVEQQHWPDR